MKTSSFIVGAVVLSFAVAASAQTTMEKKAAPPAKPADTKPAPPPPPKADVKPAQPAMPTTPPKEVADMAKAMQGNWKCKGSSSMPDGTKATWDATTKSKLDLDKWWIQMTYAAKKSKTNPIAYKGTEYRTFDGKVWHSVSVDNMGGWGHATSTGPAADGKVTWEGEASMGDMTAKSRSFEQWVTPNKELHIWGEMSMDGKTWNPMFDMNCKK